MSAAVRIIVAIVLTFGFAVAVSQGAPAASKHHHHPAKPSEQYLRSASPPADKAQK
jgi:hypothetical protein